MHLLFVYGDSIWFIGNKIKKVIAQNSIEPMKINHDVLTEGIGCDCDLIPVYSLTNTYVQIWFFKMEVLRQTKQLYLKGSFLLIAESQKAVRCIPGACKLS